MAGEMIPKAAELAKGADAAKGAGAAKDGASAAKDAGSAAKGASEATKGAGATPASSGGSSGSGAMSQMTGQGGSDGAVASAGGGSAGSGGGGSDTGSGPAAAMPGGGDEGGKGDKGSGSGGGGDSTGKGSGSGKESGSGFGGMAPGGGKNAGGKGQGKGQDSGLGMGKGDQGKAALGAAAVAPGAVAASNLLAIMALMNWMKSMFFAAAAAAGNLLSAIGAAVVAGAKAIGGFAMGVGGAIAAATGGAITAAAGAVITGVATVATVAVAATGVVTAGSNSAEETAQRDGAIIDCGPAMRSTINEINEGGGGADNSAQAEANAEKVYSIFAGMGMPDENIAGILGNWDHESGVDPTSVETIFDEPYTIGPDKQAAWDSGWDIDAVDPVYGAKFPRIDQMGVGLGQWTNSRNTLLMDYAEKVDRNWYELETQLGFMVSDDAPVRVDYIKEMIATPAGSPEAATRNFMREWEVISDDSTGARISAANSYFSKMGQWEADEDLADSILEQSGGSAGSANETAVSAAQNKCLTETAGQRADNSTMAMAMASYAYATTAEGEGNDGTQLYQDLHDAIFPGDPWYMSCDRGVAVAVRWSGTDDNYPAGPVSRQLDYLASSDKWDEVTDWGGDPENLQPGDVLLRNDSSVGHTVMYLGNEAVQQVHGDAAEPGSVIASASLDTRSPGVGTWYTGDTGLETYTVYRNVKTETNSQYDDLMPDSGITGDAPQGDGTYASPVSAPISSGYGPRIHPVTGEKGKMHNGIDFGVACGTPIKAAAAGVITRETTGGASGNRLDIDHGNGVSTGYFHQQQFKLHKGDSVEQGEVIGYVGTTGSSTGCHLHLAAIDSSGNYFDPMTIFSDLG